MKETGVLNRRMAELLSAQGHHDLMMVVDAGFAIPENIKVVDLSLKKDFPRIDEILEELTDHYSIEKIIMAEETKNISPSKFEKVKEIVGKDIDCEIIPHKNLKEMSRNVKFVIRSGDFTAYSNVLLISGAGERWYLENP